ncbi:right-handed parallel beta-helix repeat-containing protein [Winogradskyella forsetii]|uniref:right-handed parallel beta-helix repeat-containing protein n=1 Tax=Winogradskyella forsetii TaxID=2686077 RepID=UPI0015BA3EAE|nr:right-handed parallel beta-helix repeat-containing protein [Winogradskyella forsetii]
MKSIYFKVFILLVILNSVNIQAQTNYYFSSSTGSDTNIGSLSSPFESVSKLNTLVLMPGDNVLFKRGDTFIGQILIDQSGADGSPIVFDSYGTGDLPVLSGSDGNNGVPDPRSTIRIIGEEYLEFHNLIIENERFDPDENTSNDDKSYGIYFQSFLSLPESGNFEEREPFDYFRFSNVHFRNIYAVNSTSTAFNALRSSGIHFFDAFAKDIIIENCHFTDLERVGIWMRRFAADVIVRNNTFIDIGGSGAIFSRSNRVLFENNLMRFCGSNTDSRMTGRGSGMWVFASNDVVAQYNTSQHARGGGDSSGMHVDYNNSNILFQYNYSEDSAGGFCEILGNNTNVIWRYNVSVNDGTSEFGGKNRVLWVSDFAGNNSIKSDDVYIYNNTIYQGKDYKNVMSDSDIILKAETLNFYNNILALEPTARVGEASYIYDVATPNFGKNIMFGGTIKTDFKNLDPTRLEVNPQLLESGRRHFSGYKIFSSSQAIGEALSFTEPSFPLAGIGIFQDVTSNATQDLYGNPVDLSTATNIGAYNGSGVTSLDNVSTFEAEDTNNTISGGAGQITCANASGGAAVNFDGDEETLTFGNINVPTTDSYLVVLHHASASKSTIKVTVNGGETQSIIMPANNGFCFESGLPTAFPIVLNLNSGENSIQFEKGILDKIDVIATSSVTLSVEDSEMLQDAIAYLEKTVLGSDDTLRLLFYEPNTFRNTSLFIYDTNGRVLFDKKYNNNNIDISASSLGKGVKIVLAKIDGYMMVKKIVIH